MRALDLGAGDGRNAIWLAGRGWKVTAVGFSQVALDRGQARAEASGVEVEWQLADLLQCAPAADGQPAGPAATVARSSVIAGSAPGPSTRTSAVCSAPSASRTR